MERKIQPNKIYDFKKEFWPLTGISKRSWENRKQDVLEWLKNFYDYEMIEGRPIRILIKEVYGEYRPLPRKIDYELAQQKIENYKTYTIAALGNEFKPNSKSKIARDAIYDFAFDKYGHENYKYVVRKFVKEPFDKYGETNNMWVWVWSQ